MNTQPVFVLGSGRSGTHWLGRTIATHPDVTATIEAQPMFRWSLTMAMDPSIERTLFKPLCHAYEGWLEQATTPLYMDKSHQNIWLAEKLHLAFPAARFAGITRNPYATIASMLRHSGVLRWHRRWREYPVPNRFLGIEESDLETYDDLPMVAKCARRWMAHRDRMIALEGVLGDALLHLQYETFAHEPEATTERLMAFLDLPDLAVPPVHLESLDKWRSVLSDDAIAVIRDLTGDEPSDSAQRIGSADAPSPESEADEPPTRSP